MLKRQYSLDRGDDPIASDQKSSCARMSKQNSAGAAHDLEMIEEIPLMTIPIMSPCHRRSETVPCCEIAVSIDSLSLQ